MAKPPPTKKQLLLVWYTYSTDAAIATSFGISVVQLRKLRHLYKLPRRRYGQKAKRLKRPPSQKMIAKLTAEIQASWSPRRRRERLVSHIDITKAQHTVYGRAYTYVDHLKAFTAITPS